MHSIKDHRDVEQIFGPGGALEAFESAKKAGKCRFIGFTGHFDPNAHLAMLERYDKYDAILMPLHIADPGYLSFEKMVLPNAKLLPTFNVRECLQYVLSLPVHAATLGCTTIGQLEDDVRIAKEFAPLDQHQMSALRARADRIKGPDRIHDLLMSIPGSAFTD